ncbi:SGNH/GDSL hydrolase family protein [Burkholderia sp. BCC1988]|uniref:SGNH/GDSL hydrolase family protein n=1 Tax=Burkholderia sp. BCC1988 TaxID=2817443 RepID=UPI002AAF8C05|nr:SGNH/GDSL hydrolase family protein [Burkholderia sp. BCC1988]
MSGFVRKATLPALAASLPNWKRGGVAGKKVAWVGDSTTYIIATTGQIQNYLNSTYVSEPGSPLYGVTNLWFGSNGNTLYNFLHGTPAGFGIGDVIAAAPDLIVLCYGINDTRQGATSQAQLVTMLKQAVNTLLAALPNTDIVLRMPNSFLTTDPGGFGYVVPISNAQQYSSILQGAYLALENVWPNVPLVKIQGDVFPEVCPAAGTLWSNQIHPSVAGYERIIDDVVQKQIGWYPAYSAALAAQAIATDYTNAHTYYPRVVETDDYQLLTTGAFSTQGSGYLNFGGDVGWVGQILPGDIVVQNGQSAFTLPATVGVINNAGVIDLTNLGAGNPTYAQAGGTVSIYRHKYAGIAAAKPYLSGSTAYPASRRLRISAAGNGFIRLQSMPGEEPDVTTWNFQNGDVLLLSASGVVTLAGISVSLVAGALQISMPGTDFTGNSGQCFVASKNFEKPGELEPMPVTLDRVGVLAAETLTRTITRGGVYATLIATLLTVGTTQTTVQLYDNGTLFATVTFPPNNGAGSIAWASGSSATILPGHKITAVITPGTNAAGLSLVLDV